jgi:predicted Na+-dependent transporter
VGQLAGSDSGLAATGYTFITFVGASIGPLIANAGEFKLVTAILVSILCIALGTALKIKDTELQHTNPRIVSRLCIK